MTKEKFNPKIYREQLAKDLNYFRNEGEKGAKKARTILKREKKSPRYKEAEIEQKKYRKLIQEISILTKKQKVVEALSSEIKKRLDFLIEEKKKLDGEDKISDKKEQKENLENLSDEELKKMLIKKIGADEISDFHEGIAWIRVNGDYFYINREGNGISSKLENFDEAGDFHNGVARVKKDGEYYYIDKYGKRISRRIGF